MVEEPRSHYLPVPTQEDIGEMVEIGGTQVPSPVEAPTPADQIAQLRTDMQAINSTLNQMGVDINSALAA